MSEGTGTVFDNNNNQVANQAGHQVVQGNLNIYHGSKPNEGELDPRFSGMKLTTNLSDVFARLTFSGIDDREQQLDEAGFAQASLEWIWDTDFPEWLRSSEAVYYIIGKPGSGKSTLAKYLADHRLTLKYLKEDGQKWLIAKFFFNFRAHDQIANNIEGLYRSLLIQILQQLPSELGSVATAMLNQNSSVGTDKLLQCLRQAVSNQQSTICAFIDGLDEFSGDMTLLVRRLIQLRDQLGFKMCLCSRPGITVSALSQRRTLLLENFNHVAIEKCITETFRAYGLGSSEMYQGLQNKIFNKAEGMILWAQLACRNILDGHLQGESRENMETSLENLAPGMKALYNDILSKTFLQNSLEKKLVLHLVRTGHRPLYTKKLFRGLQRALLLANIDTLLMKHMDERLFGEWITNMFGGLLSFYNPYPYVSSDRSLYVELCHETLESYLSDRMSRLMLVPPASKSLFTETIWLQIYGSIIENSADMITECLIMTRRLDRHLQPQAIQDKLLAEEPLMNDAVSLSIAHASSFDQQSVDYCGYIRSSLKSDFAELHFRSCYYGCDRNRGCLKGEPSLSASHIDILQRYDLQVAVQHGLVAYLEHESEQLELWQRDFLVDIALNSNYAGDRAGLHSIEHLLQTGTKLRMRHLCIAVRYIIWPLPLEWLKQYWVEDDPMDGCWSHCKLKRDGVSSRAFLLQHWVSSEMPHTEFLRSILSERNIINEKCSAEGTALHTLLRQDLLEQHVVLVSKHSYSSVSGLEAELEDIYGPITDTGYKFLLLLSAGADPTIKGTGEHARKTVVDRVQEIQKYAMIQRWRFDKGKMERNKWTNQYYSFKIISRVLKMLANRKRGC